MQAIILAAGVSKRLRPLTDATPKCLLSLGKKTLLQKTIENLIENGINEFIFVTGYKENMIKDFINNFFPGIEKIFITNSGYENNNNSYSLWMTRNSIKDNILLLDSDILFDKGIIMKLLKAEYENCLAVNFNDKPDEEQIKVVLNKQNQVLEIGKKVSLDHSAGESIGIEKFSAYFMKELFIILDRKITVEKSVNEFYEASFQELIQKDYQEQPSNLERNSIYGVDVSEFTSMEIDTIQDYENAKRILTYNE